MTLDRFTEQLNEIGEIDLIIKFRRPRIKAIFIEKYFFKKVKNNIESYENGKKTFETPSIPHMYFIYRKALTFEKYIKTKKKDKAKVRFAGGIIDE